jgi:hypothetical protein
MLQLQEEHGAAVAQLTVTVNTWRQYIRPCPVRNAFSPLTMAWQPAIRTFTCRYDARYPGTTAGSDRETKAATNITI